ncbi:lipopolysaccharide biosynthesis protein [bacterium]|nr:lipopolysaccharide biosynthesis protein [bacterium]
MKDENVIGRFDYDYDYEHEHEHEISRTMGNLKQQTIHALKWNFVGTASMQAIHFVISVVLARLLMPAEFGLIAMLSLFMALASSMLDCGFGSALIQKLDAGRRDMTTVFYFNIAMSAVMFGTMWAAAPAIAGFFGEPALVGLTRFLGINLIINAFGLVQGTLLTKALDFKTQSIVAVIGMIVSGTVGVGLALRGFGVWALAAQSVTANSVRVLLYWRMNPWRPAWTFSFSSLRTMFPYGSRLLLSGMLNTVFENAYPLLIGKLYNKTDLGFYARASTTQRMPAGILTTILAQVAFPAFATIQNDRPRLKAAYRKTIVLACFLAFPLMLGLAAVARPLFLIVFTAKWEASIVYFQALCLVGMLMPLQALNLNVLMAVGRSDIFFRLEVLKKIIIVAAIVATCPFGIMAMVWGQVVTAILCLAVNTRYSGVMIDYPLRAQLRDVAPSFLLAGAMAIAVGLIGLGARDHLWTVLTAQVLVGIVFYAIGSAVFGLGPYAELKKMASGRFATFKQMAAGS